MSPKTRILGLILSEDSRLTRAVWNRTLRKDTTDEKDTR